MVAQLLASGGKKINESKRTDVLQPTNEVETKLTNYIEHVTGLEQLWIQKNYQILLVPSVVLHVSSWKTRV